MSERADALPQSHAVGPLHLPITRDLLLVKATDVDNRFTHRRDELAVYLRGEVFDQLTVSLQCARC